MEMQVFTLEEDSAAVDEATTTRGRVSETEEKIEDATYSTLRTPTEDTYVSTIQPLMKCQPEGQNLGKVLLYRRLCILLGFICLVLVLVILILGLKLSTKPEGVINRGLVSKDEKFYPPHVGCVPGSCCKKCPQGWLSFDSSCFFLSKSRLSWEQSRKECQTKGGDLAIISEQKVQNFLTSQGIRMYWIGLSYRNSKWIWVNNTAMVTSYFTERQEWDVGNCGVLTGGDPPEKSWSPSPCHYNTFYICQTDI